MKKTTKATGTKTQRRQGATQAATIAKLSSEKARLAAQNASLRKELSTIKRSTEETIRSERLHALGQMASGIVHDFNNSLTPILGASDFLIANPHVLSRQADTLRLLESIKVAAYDAKNMVSQLREFYRPQEHSNVDVIDVNALVKESIMLTRPKWREQAGERNVEVTIREDFSDDCNVLINATHLREVLTNLLINAVDALDRNGTITVRTRRSGGRVIIHVTDTGRGMTREVRQHCFEPFFSTKGKNGTGLGLSVTYGIISKYGGTIRVLSTAPNKGTTIEIKLPAAQNAPTPATVAEDAPNKSTPIKVLVCEQDPMTRQTVAEYLRADGHEIDLASSGQSALNKIRHGRFDLVMIDGLMPSGNGVTILKELMKSCEACAVIVTGVSGPEHYSAGMSGGVAVPLEKPFTQKDLRNAIAKAKSNRSAK